jgi:hypothetical protein
VDTLYMPAWDACVATGVSETDQAAMTTCLAAQVGVAPDEPNLLLFVAMMFPASTPPPAPSESSAITAPN